MASGRWTTEDLERKGFSVEKQGANLVATKVKRVEQTFTQDAQKLAIYMDKKAVFNVLPCPKPRMTRRDKWLNPPRPPVIRYRAFCDAIRAAADELNFRLPDANFHIVFHMPIPKSLIKKIKEGDPHRKKPDSDNLLKAVFDALSKTDQTIFDYRVSKYYSTTPCITFETIS